MEALQSDPECLRAPVGFRAIDVAAKSCDHANQFVQARGPVRKLSAADDRRQKKGSLSFSSSRQTDVPPGSDSFFDFLFVSSANQLWLPSTIEFIEN